MKKLLFALCLSALIRPVLQAQDLTSQDRDRAIKYLQETRANLLKATAGLSEAQWNFKPATNRWSVAEVTEHIAAAEAGLLGMVQNQVMKAPPRTGTDDVKELDEWVVTTITNRTVKAQAPETLVPTNRF